jgi:transposase
MTKHSPEIIELNSQQIEELLDRAASNTLRDEDTQLMRLILESYAGFFTLVGDKNTTIARLRKLMFGLTSEKSKDVLGDEQDPSSSPPDEDAADDAGETDNEVSEPPSGHGRHGADDYPGAKQVKVDHPTLATGDDCPACSQGTLYEKSPSVLVRFVGQAPLQATVYRMQKLRCGNCGKIFTAPAPEGVGDQKYDATAASMIGLLKYGSGLPFNRLERLE